jgi:light-regulated signal transduction histidine kinase (bacteriophytochrome)
LSLARIGRCELRRTRVDLSAVARRVLERLAATHPERSVEAIVPDHVAAYGDLPLLKVVLENLLGNAWKFTGKRSHARIELGTQAQVGRTVYFVRDNGAGFDMNYAAKMFGAFQRLHTSSEFEGTGIGLATVQRIVRRHGGRVWAESTIGEGATFYFTLAETA